MSSENTAAPQAHKPNASGGALDRYFKITERGSSISAEIRGGLAAFFAMSYIVVLNPLVIGTGADSAGNTLGVPQVAAVTALVAGVMTILMGVIAKQPFAMAAGLGVNALLASTIATTPGLTWADIMGLVIIAGLIMTVLVLTGFRTAVFEAVPESLKTAIVAGIGFFIAFIGLFLTIALFIRNVRGAILIGVVASTVLAIILEAVFHIGSSKGNPTGWSLNVPALNNFSFSAPDFSLIGSARFGAFGAIGVLGASLLVFAILLSVFFDAMGVSVGLATEAGTIDKDGKVENINEVLLVDAVGSVVGGGASGSANQIFVESATGIGEGARTGLANIVTGVLFLVAIIASPLVTIVPFEAVAPALVVVGFLMVRQAVHIDWQDWGLGIPAFMTIIFMPLSYSIANGIGAGFVSYAFIRLVQGRGREVHWLMYVVSAVFVIYFGMGIINGFTH